MPPRQIPALSHIFCLRLQLHRGSYFYPFLLPDDGNAILRGGSYTEIHKAKTHTSTSTVTGQGHAGDAKQGTSGLAPLCREADVIAGGTLSGWEEASRGMMLLSALGNVCVHVRILEKDAEVGGDRRSRPTAPVSVS